MRKKISNGIIIFASLSPIMTIAVAFGYYLIFYSIMRIPIPIPLFVFGLVYIITITFLILLKNWARITYIIIHIILALFTLYIFIELVSLGLLALGGAGVIAILLILQLLCFYFIGVIYCFLRSDTAKLFKQ